MCPSVVNGLAVMGKSWPRPKLACGVGAMVLIHVHGLGSSGTCQAGVNSCQVGLRSAPLPRARAAEGAGH